MALPVRTCVDCGETYSVTPNKPGRITQCAECGSSTERRSGLKPYMALVEPTSKNSSETSIILTQDVTYAQHFNKMQQRRGGAGVNSSFLHG